ncbi:hypothetical protein COL154_011336 [Colletotrichum chrysophilum]|uniref:uncharacterized protein n=1 Tax=Colletotrichum chrysophilum TaxID=1836956 RepID=UPI00230093DB|nr:uncharacterized protein COL26b_009746 [Colletotrichum chrysophilum]KAJ0343251.1 hypothetical protein KNSL1_010314 [Colletotrichum chrysophilum]KAJ0355700.1 hypothetical protein COL154_011336 [Colletotrichum chrysophilum]KAJ0371038.1 hypothetical protein COL26b_009746 [Colletotrichum chrysophilum]
MTKRLSPSDPKWAQYKDAIEMMYVFDRLSQKKIRKKLGEVGFEVRKSELEAQLRFWKVLRNPERPVTEDLFESSELARKSLPGNPLNPKPPCNTLYVGNLPIDTSEEELKAVFAKQIGYVRLCFRTKQHGPMCFVQFEDVSFATKALHELYGYPFVTTRQA